MIVEYFYSCSQLLVPLNNYGIYLLPSRERLADDSFLYSGFRVSLSFTFGSVSKSILTYYLFSSNLDLFSQSQATFMSDANRCLS